MNCYIYARVSSVNDRQSTERQVLSLTKYATSNGYNVAGVYEEHISGVAKDKKVLKACLEGAKDNGIGLILFSEVSRCGRAIWEVLSSIKYCVDNHIDVYFQKENLHLFQGEAVNKIMAIYISALAMCAEVERENIYYRLSQGRELAKAKGVRMGRKIGSVETREQKEQKHGDIIRYLRKGCSIRDTAKLCSCGISTVQRIKKDFGI